MTERKPLKPLMISFYDLLDTIENDKALYKYIELGDKIFVWNGRNYINPDNEYDLMCEFDLASCRKPMIKILSYIYCTDTCEEYEDTSKGTDDNGEDEDDGSNSDQES